MQQRPIEDIFLTGQYDQAIADYDKAIEIVLNYGKAYKSRAVSYFHKKEYHKAWADVYKAQS